MTGSADRNTGRPRSKKAIAIAATRREAGMRVSMAVAGTAMVLTLLLFTVALRLGA